MSKLVVKKLYKVFGHNQRKAMQLLQEGLGKEEIQKRTGATIGIHNANFEVREGETFVIMGLSGSGKSTVVRCINRLIEPTAGEIMINGQNLLDMNKKELITARRHWLGMVFQSFALLPNRTILANTEYGLEVKGVPAQQRRDKAMEALQLVGLSGYESSYPDQLSGGMKQRVGLARALANDVEILLMDEAFSALDPLIRSDMQDELLDLQKKMKKTIVFITHDLDEALKLGDRIMIMKDGQTAQIGTPEEILSKPADDYVRRFVQGVDRSRMLTAADIMTRPWTTMRVTQGPRMALKELRKHGLDRVLVLSEQGRRLLGAVTVDGVNQLLQSGEQSLHHAVDADLVNTVKPDCSIEKLIQQTASGATPLSVVDDSGKLLGVIVRSTVLSAINTAREDD